MNWWRWTVAAVVTGTAAVAPVAGAVAGEYLATPPQLTLESPLQYESVYAPPAAPSPDEGVNAGAVHTDISVSYLNDYIFRGIEPFEENNQQEKSLNLQFSGKMSFDLGKAPHPFIGVFTNVSESDPISNFQEIRPYFGADWNLRPLILTAGLNTYVYPNRPDLQTAEVYGKIKLDDSYFTRADHPLLSPYILGAYDYDKYKGWYLEAGVEHDFEFPDIGVTLTMQAAVAYVHANELFAGPTGQDSGFQHYQLGLIADYSLNNLLNIPQRYGQWSLRGYLFYTDGIRSQLRSESRLYGGGGIALSY